MHKYLTMKVCCSVHRTALHKTIRTPLRGLAQNNAYVLIENSIHPGGSSTLFGYLHPCGVARSVIQSLLKKRTAWQMHIFVTFKPNPGAKITIGSSAGYYDKCTFRETQ